MGNDVIKGAGEEQQRTPEQACDIAHDMLVRAGKAADESERIMEGSKLSPEDSKLPADALIRKANTHLEAARNLTDIIEASAPVAMYYQALGCDKIVPRDTPVMNDGDAADKLPSK